MKVLRLTVCRDLGKKPRTNLIR